MFGGGGHYPDEGAAKWVVSEKKGGPGEGEKRVRQGVKYVTRGVVLACRDLHLLHDGFGGQTKPDDP